MNLYSIKETTLIAIGDAIRAKNGSTDTYTSEEFAAAIESIVATGGGEGGSSGGPGVIEHVSITGTAYDSLGYQYDLTPYMDRDFYFVNWIRTSSSVDPYFQHFIYHAADGTTESLGYGNDPLTTTKANAAKAKGSLANGILTLDYYSSSYAIQKTCHLFVCNAGAGGSGGITPEGEIEIIENGDFDVTTYASAHVAVPVGVFPTGEKQITVNGNYDITNFATVSVEVPTGGGSDDVEDVLLTGSCAYACSGAIAGSFIKMFGNKITTQGISDASNMFFSSTVESIPFTLNFTTTNHVAMNNMFQNNLNLKTLPTIPGTVQPNATSNMFMNCQRLRNIPEDYFDNWNFTRMQTYAYAQFGAMFQNCYSLRNIPTKLLENMCGIQTISTYLPYFNAFAKCYVLDEIIGLGVQTSTLTSNAFSNNPFGECNRLKRLTFATNSDGTPKTANWKNQTIDLSGANNFNTVGYTTLYTNITNYNSGITQDKEVKDDATYQTLKNDPDWWTQKWGYSRYNKTSAIETINSLPDCSASGGTNTIKFKGVAGSKTDGGAINTMEQEYIDLAASKGWTVQFA